MDESRPKDESWFIRMNQGPKAEMRSNDESI